MSKKRRAAKIGKAKAAEPQTLSDQEAETVQGGRTTISSSNNLKQIGVALHNYHDSVVPGDGSVLPAVKTTR